MVNLPRSHIEVNMEDDNGRVTMAVLGEKIDGLTKKVDTLTLALTQIQDNRNELSRLGTRLENTCEDVKSLENRVNGWGVINSLGVVFASIIGIFINHEG
jgi:hypothetical protein